MNPLAAEGVDIVTRAAVGGDYIDVRHEPETRAAEGSTDAVMFGFYAVHDVWYEIRSMLEGDFMERVAAGAGRKTIADHWARVRAGKPPMIQSRYDHGWDPTIGDKPLGPLTTLEDTARGGYYEVPLLDTDYNREYILPALEGRTINGQRFGSLLGASFRLRVIADAWDMEPEPSETNPAGLPERTITQYRMMELGPTPIGANPDATAGVRSLTDHYFSMSRPTAALGTAATDTDTTDTKPPQGHSGRSATMLRVELAALTRKNSEPT